MTNASKLGRESMQDSNDASVEIGCLGGVMHRFVISNRAFQSSSTRLCLQHQHQSTPREFATFCRDGRFDSFDSGVDVYSPRILDVSDTIRQLCTRRHLPIARCRDPLRLTECQEHHRLFV